jgi:hypothetical protein
MAPFMKRGLFILFSAIQLIFTAHFAHADEPEYGLLAREPRAFPALEADPREVQLELRAMWPVGQSVQGEVILGEYLSLYKWRLPWQDAYIQWMAGGAVFSRFNLVEDTKDLKVSDYSANMPVDLRAGRWAMRLMPFHVSSHLGDDFIAATGRLPRKYSVDSIKMLASFEPTPAWRIYGGYQYIMRVVHEGYGRNVLQGGLEWHSPWGYRRERLQLYAAGDFQAWERTGWNPMLNIQSGLRVRRDAESRRSMSIFLEFGSGSRQHGQFYQEKETHWGAGLKFAVW